MRYILVMFLGLVLGTSLCAQNYSDEIEFLGQNGDVITVISSATHEKKKEAEQLAMKSAFNSLFHTGIPGVKDGTPMMSEKRADYDYRFFNDARFINYIVGQPETLQNKKIANRHKSSVKISINLRTLKAELTRNKIALNPNWLDAKQAKATSALNPQIVVVPYVDAASGYSFESMRDQFESNRVKRFVVDKVAEVFKNHGYKTYDFINILQDSKMMDMLRNGAQSDDATMIVQQLPGDIVVTAEVSVYTSGGISELSLNLRALEKQTSGRLATATFSSDRHHSTDSLFLASHAVKKVQKNFFAQLDDSFKEMIQKGREVNIDLNLSSSVSDWDFEQDSPATGEFFKDALDEWLRQNSMNQVYDMSRSTDKYVRITLNVPLWNMERNRPYTLSNFGSELRKFFRAQLGQDYRANISSLGQKMVVTVE